MRVSYIHGICVNHDAISNSIRDEITWLLSVPGNEIRLFTYICDFPELPFIIAKDLKDVIFDPFFQQSDLVIFHFGVYYPLFNLMPVVPTSAKKIVVFHNVTPKALMPESAHETIDKSFRQISNMAFADHIVCDSQINKEMLVSAGINVPATVLPLALHNHAHMPQYKPSFDDGITRICFVGRLVKSKGPIDLLIAASTVLAERQHALLKIDFVSNVKFSDPEVVADLEALSEKMLACFDGRLTINFHGNATETLKNELLANADLFVLPTRHEGFCVPILEALANACYLVSYDNSNVPHISGGFGKLVTTGDRHALAQAISSALDLTQSEDWKTMRYVNYCTQVTEYCKQFTPEKARIRFLHLVSDVLWQRGRSNL